MSVETVTNPTIKDLDPLLPRNNDLVIEGDNHLRFIKQSIKNSLPKFNKAIRISADSLNYLEEYFEFSDESVNINRTVTVVGDNLPVNMNGNKIKNVGDPTQSGDAITLGSMNRGAFQAASPVGSYYLSSEPTNPAEVFGFGTWEENAQGKVLLGAGTFTDIGNSTRLFSVNSVGGTYGHVISQSEMPAHSHGSSGISASTGPAGSHQHNLGNMVKSGGGSGQHHVGHGSQEIKYRDISWNYNGEHSHTVTLGGSTGLTGGNEPMNITQPHIVCHIFHRVA